MYNFYVGKMTCDQLGGACDKLFIADSFDEISTMSQNHGKEMFAQNDKDHIAAMNQMMELMKSGKMDEWMAERKKDFENSN